MLMCNYVIVDLEMCNVPQAVRQKGYQFRNELIQIGAVLLGDDLEIADTFVSYVAPEYGVLDEYIELLTGITNRDLQGAPHLKEALQSFLDWLPADAIPVSWSMSDEKQIRKEVEFKNLVFDGLEQYLDRWIDCQKTFAERMHTEKRYKLSEALIIADIDLEDGEHDALVDARNTALLFAKMQREPSLKLNPYYISEGADSAPAYCPFADLLANFDFAE